MEEYRILNSVGVPAFAADLGRPAAPVVFWSDSLGETSGVAADAVLGRPLASVVGGGAKAAERLRAGEASIRCGPVIGARTGDAVTLAPVRFGNGRSVAVGTVRTDGRAALREKFLAMAAHDLRAPVRNILVLTGILRDGADGDTEALRTLDMIDGVAARAQRLVGELLTVAASAEPGESPFEIVGLAEIASEEAAALDPEARTRLVADPVSLVTDRVLLSLALRMLIGNALRHGGDGVRTVRVRAERDAQRGFVALTVSDDGKGLDADARAFIEGGGFRYGSGYGLLGLRRIAEARGGRLSLAEDSRGGGGLVRVTLPGRLLARRPGRGGTFREAS